MNNQMEIIWSQAKEVSEQAIINNKKEQAKALNEFRTSFCDMFTISDWMYYAEKTEWSIQKLREYAKYQEEETTLKDYVYGFLGSELDEDDLYSLDF